MTYYLLAWYLPGIDSMQRLVRYLETKQDKPEDVALYLHDYWWYQSTKYDEPVVQTSITHPKNAKVMAVTEDVVKLLEHRYQTIEIKPDTLALLGIDPMRVRYMPKVRKAPKVHTQKTLYIPAPGTGLPVPDGYYPKQLTLPWTA